MKRRLLLATAATLLATPAFAQTKWDLPAAYPATNYPQRQPPEIRRWREGGDRRQARDHRPSRRLAVQGARDQARGADRPGADRRGPGGPTSRTRTRSTALDVVPFLATSFAAAKKLCGGAEAGAREEGSPPRASIAAVRRAVAAAGPLRQEGDQLARRHEGPEVPRLQPRHLAHRRADRRAAHHHPGRRTQPGAGHRQGRLVHLLGRHRRRHQGVGAAHPLLRHAGLAAEERRADQQGRLRQARRCHQEGRAGRGRQGRGAGLGREPRGCPRASSRRWPRTA